MGGAGGTSLGRTDPLSRHLQGLGVSRAGARLPQARAGRGSGRAPRRCSPSAVPLPFPQGTCQSCGVSGPNLWACLQVRAPRRRGGVERGLDPAGDVRPPWAVLEPWRGRQAWTTQAQCPAQRAAESASPRPEALAAAQDRKGRQVGEDCGLDGPSHRRGRILRSHVSVSLDSGFLLRALAFPAAACPTVTWGPRP